MKIRLLILGVALCVVLNSKAFAQSLTTQATFTTVGQINAVGQNIVSQENVSTLGTVRLPKTIESAWNTVLAAPMSTASSVVSVTTSSVGIDSLARKDDSALILTAFSLSQFGIGGKLWLTENTAVRVGANADIDLALTLFGGHRGSQSYRQAQINGQQSTNQQAQINGSGSGRFANQSSIGVSCSIEKHVFQKRTISPYIALGLDASVSFNSWISGGGSGQKNIDSVDFSIGNGSTGMQTQTQGSNGQQALHAGDFYRFGAHLLVGVEYFVLPSISLAAQAGISGHLGFSYSVDVNNQTNVPAQNINPQANQARVSQVSSDQTVNATPTFGVYASTWFSISAQVYLGRGAAKEMANAFLNIFL